MMNDQLLTEKFELFLKDFIESQVDSFLDDDDDYQMKATALKSAKQLKQEHLNRIKESLLMKDFRTSMTKAVSLIFTKLPQNINHEDFKKILSEMDHILEHLASPPQLDTRIGEEPRTIIFRNLWGISNDTLLNIHHFANVLIEKREYEEANDLLIFLVTISPDIAGFWISRGICLQGMDRDEEALQVLHVAKVLIPDDPIPMIYTIHGFLKVKDKEKGSEEILHLEECLNNHPEEKQKWNELLISLKEQYTIL
jgi:tetratricopeptide (TPR) repeat protein